ncbi:MAG: DNA polymerase IV, partial [Dokdonella sp.]
PEVAPASQDELIAIALALLDRVHLEDGTRYRLVGVGLSGFREPDEVSQRSLFPE